MARHAGDADEHLVAGARFSEMRDQRVAVIVPGKLVLRIGCVFRMMPITVPGRCRSRFRDDADHCSGLMPITNRRTPEW
jgi:hypothetical protein